MVLQFYLKSTQWLAYGGFSIRAFWPYYPWDPFLLSTVKYQINFGAPTTVDPVHLGLYTISDLPNKSVYI